MEIGIRFQLKTIDLGMTTFGGYFLNRICRATFSKRSIIRSV
jgi:hypothetical protein